MRYLRFASLVFLCGYYIMNLIFLYTTLYIAVRYRTILLKNYEEVGYEVWIF